jgi:hypothetical protein
MPVTIVESDAFPASLQAPQAAELASAPSLISQFLQGIANRSRYLLNRLAPFIDGGNVNAAGPVNLLGGPYGFDSMSASIGSITALSIGTSNQLLGLHGGAGHSVPIPLTPYEASDPGNTVKIVNALSDPPPVGPAVYLQFAQADDSDALLWHCSGLPPYGRITAVSAIILGQGAGLPSTMPAIALIRDNLDGTATVIGSQSDTSASVPAFTAYHSLSLTGLTAGLASGARYLIRLKNQSSAANMRVIAVSATITA